MQKKNQTTSSATWLQGEIRLAGALDSRMINLLNAIEQSGSINQAAKQMGLSYKGAWQIIERANNLSPKALISTATGGSKGGGTCLTSAGKALLKLFTELEQQHQQFILSINQRLEADAEMLLLLKPLIVKTSATNQLFGTVVSIQTGSITTEIFVVLKGGEKIIVSLTQAEFETLSLYPGSHVLLLINSSDISLLTDLTDYSLSARNCLPGQVIRIQQDGVDSEIVIRLPGDDSLSVLITETSAKALGLELGVTTHAVFKSNAVIIAAAKI